MKSCIAEVADNDTLSPKMKLPYENYSRNVNENVQLCQENEDWCSQRNGRGFVSFVKVILEKLNDGALIESLKSKLRSHSEAKRSSGEADEISCFYSND